MANISHALGAFLGGLGRRVEPFVAEGRGRLEEEEGAGNGSRFWWEKDSELGERVGAFGAFGLNPGPLFTS